MGRTDIERLKKIYLLYDEAMASIDNGCREKCSACCTCNVTLTSLEAEFLAAGLTRQEKEGIKKQIDHQPLGKRYVPQMTPNMFARMCVQGNDLPEEENDPDWGICPLLADDLCSIYPFRPFGCRALMSQVNCRQKGYAEIPPIALTLNNLFLQYIEHLAGKNLFGNLSDLVPLVLSGKDVTRVSGGVRIPGDGRFIFTEKITVLMVPPEHRHQVRPLLEKLSRLVSN